MGGLAVVTISSGGLPVVQASNNIGLAVTEAASLRGIAVTKVAARGLPVVYVTEAGVVVPPAGAGTTFNPATVLNASLSNGNLTATHVGTATNSGARGLTALGSGKYYFEIRVDVPNSADAVGLITPAAGYGAFTCYTAIQNGNINCFGVSSGTLGAGFVATNLAGIAVDFTAGLLWFRGILSSGGSGNWNGNASANPATAVGGIAFTPGTAMMPGVYFGLGSGGEKYTANFGATAYTSSTPPSGFGNWT